MSYLGYIAPICRDHLAEHTYPKILEIGVEHGLATLPLIQNLASRFEQFFYAGIDISVKYEVQEQVAQFVNINFVNETECITGRDVFFFEENSLNWLQQGCPMNMKYDVVFLDGDHNYFTVTNELKLIQSIIKPTSIIVCDDYNGKWAEKDMFYADREGYESNKLATQNTFSEKQGIKNAIDDFINRNKNTWSSFSVLDTDPAFLFRKDMYACTIDDQIHQGRIMGNLNVRDMNFSLKKLDN